MTLGYIYFGVLAVLAVVGAIATVASPNPIRGAMGLLLSIVSIAGLFLALHAQFLGAIQLIVYAGAVVVLFIFVIMLLGPSSDTEVDDRGQFVRGGAAALFGLVGLVSIGFLARAIGKNVLAPPVVGEDFGSIDAIGKAMFTDAVVPFELSSALLIVAVVAAMAVARGKQEGESKLKLNLESPTSMLKRAMAPSKNHDAVSAERGTGTPVSTATSTPLVASADAAKKAGAHG
jgi:NADH-quinone oxidoreductase subunit J